MRKLLLLLCILLTASVAAEAQMKNTAKAGVALTRSVRNAKESTKTKPPTPVVSQAQLSAQQRQTRNAVNSLEKSIRESRKASQQRIKMMQQTNKINLRNLSGTATDHHSNFLVPKILKSTPDSLPSTTPLP